jgi:hypothetical protein
LVIPFNSLNIAKSKVESTCLKDFN